MSNYTVYLKKYVLLYVPYLLDYFSIQMFNKVCELHSIKKLENI